MTLDITHLKPGDLVRLRNGEIKKVNANDDGSRLPVRLDDGRWYRPNGEYNDTAQRCFDIIEILPTARDLLVKTETTYGSKPIAPAKVLTLTHNRVGFEHPDAINCNDKRYVPADSVLINPVPPISYIHHPTKGLIGIRYQGQLFTPADAWPEPIKDRAPTKEDADEDGDIQRYSMGGWYCEQFNPNLAYSEGWAHTPIWKPKSTPVHTREEVIDMLRDGAIFHNSDVEPDLIDSILTHLEANV